MTYLIPILFIHKYLKLRKEDKYMKSVNVKAAIATLVVLVVIGGFIKQMMSDVKEYTISENFENIEVYGQSDRVKIGLSKDNNTYISCRKSDKVKLSGNTLVVKEEREFFKIINFNNPDTKIYLPEKDYKKLLIDTVSSSIELDDELSFENVQIKSVSGSIKSNILVQDTATFSSTSGSLNIQDLDCDSVGISTISGSIKLDNIICNTSMIIETTSGSLNFDKVDSPSIEISSVSGSINGKILSSKQYTVSTVSGSISVPQNKGDETCVIETVSGSINIK